MSDHKGLIGSATTVAGGIVAWLPIVNEAVQIVAGLAAIAVAVATLRYYHKKSKAIK